MIREKGSYWNILQCRIESLRVAFSGSEIRQLCWNVKELPNHTKSKILECREKLFGAKILLAKHGFVSQAC